MSCSLIVNADDYGRTPGVSTGIRDAHLRGIVTTTTVLINLPGATDAVRRAAVECGCRVRAACPFDPADQTLLGDAPPGAQAFACERASARQTSVGLAPSPHLFTQFYDQGATMDALLCLLDKLPQCVSEIMCRPGFSDAALESVSSYVRERQIEHGILTDPRIRERIRASGIQLATYRSASGLHS